MDWKLPDFMKSAWDSVKPTKKQNSTSSYEKTDGNNVVHQCDLVPFRRVENSVHMFVDISVPTDLDRLFRHQNNIRKYRKQKDFTKLHSEYVNATATVQKLTRNLHDMETLRAHVDPSDLQEFDRRIKPAKDKANETIKNFLEIHDEEINSQGQIERHDANIVDARNNSRTCGVRKIARIAEPEDRDDDERIHGKVSLRGNQIIITPVTSCYTEPVAVAESDISAVEYDDASSGNYEQQTSQMMMKACEETQESWEKLRKDLVDLHETIQDFSSLVHHQGKVVDDISSNVETAGTNIKQGKVQLRRATLLKAAMFPVVGAVVGGAVGGPIGFLAGLKLGSVTGGLAAAGITGTVIGYQGGKLIKKQHETKEHIEMTNLKTSRESLSDEEFEKLHYS